MDKTCVVLDEKTKVILNQLQIKLLTQNTSYVVRLALSHLGEKILGKNSSIEIFPIATKLSVPRLPGMTDRVIRSQMDRFNLTTEEYETIVRHVVDNFAASGGQIKNAEAVIFGACRRYAKERDAQKKVQHSSEQPPEPATENPYELQDRLG